MIESDAWPSLWRRHLDKYLSKPARTGFWMDTWFGSKASSFLELGCGSGRDTVYLAEQGHTVVGTDLDAETLAELQRRFEGQGATFQPADAANLEFPDNSFDVVFHNGLWVLFEDDAFITRMLEEQVRVARKYAVIIVHNADNAQLVRSFGRRAEDDALYDIRFFNVDDVRALVEASGVRYKKMGFLKFGGRMDLLYQKKRVKKILPNIFWPVRHRAVPRLYQVEPWEKIERVACVLEL